MRGLYDYLDNLMTKRAEVEKQDIDAIVEAKLKELEPQIRAEAEEAKAKAKQVLDIKIEAITEAVSIVEAEVKAVIDNTPDETVNEEVNEEVNVVDESITD